ncbi:MAG: signal transduction histidine kinase [Haloquadratum walsbyi J07HQW2]|uniref:histidine kinase n=2 Tax=Haloquadratum walsbyi TaxID=293091 RepID=U1PL80_9EURY|nr:MAG: signal transduction histidine kinase [Haloquadratum walsbyi J07HQW2]
MTQKWNRRLIPPIILGSGILYLCIVVIEMVYVLFVSNPLGDAWIAGLVTSVPFIFIVIYQGVWLPTSFVSPRRYQRVGLWYVGGLSIFLIINLIIMVTITPDSGFEFLSWGRWAMTIGAGIGLLIGVFEARSVKKAIEAERERVRAEEAENKNEMLKYLNATLRHEILNSTSIITGYADLALSEQDTNESISNKLSIIKSHTQEMEGVIEDVRLLLEASKNEADTQPIDLIELLTEEIETIQNTYSEVVIETSLPEHAVAEADQPLRRVFANLFHNAVEHNNAETPQISVAVEMEPNDIIIEISDNGPGIPDDRLDTVFDQNVRHDSNHGLGLALTQTIINSYDGSIKIAETDSDGTVFELRLTRATVPSPEQQPSIPQ